MNAVMKAVSVTDDDGWVCPKSGRVPIRKMLQAEAHYTVRDAAGTLKTLFGPVCFYIDVKGGTPKVFFIGETNGPQMKLLKVRNWKPIPR